MQTLVTAKRRDWQQLTNPAGVPYDELPLEKLPTNAQQYGPFKAKASPEAAVEEVEADATAKADSAEAEAKTVADNAEAVVVKGLPKV